MFPFRVYPSVTFNLTRTLVVGASVCVSVVLILVYLYSHNHYQREHLPLSYRLLPNGTKIVVVVEPATNSPVDRWHEKIRAALQTSANFGFIHAFVASISVIVVSELGDKTFFIAAIMAMRHSRLVIYAGAMAALAAMTVLSALLGNIVTNFIPRSYTYYISSVLFAGFGVKMLRDGYLMSPEEGTDEYEEAQHEVDKAENNDDLEAGATRATPKQRTCVTLRRYVSPIFLQALVMTFLAVRLGPFCSLLASRSSSGMGRPIANHHHRFGRQRKSLRRDRRRNDRTRLLHRFGRDRRPVCRSTNLAENSDARRRHRLSLFRHFGLFHSSGSLTDANCNLFSE